MTGASGGDQTNSTARPPAPPRPPGLPRYIVLMAPAAPAPTALLLGLAQRQVSVLVAADAPTVMVYLAEAEASALVIAEPGRQPRLGELLSAVERYYPWTRLWQYQSRDRHGRPTLTRLNPAAPTAHEPTLATLPSDGHTPAQPPISEAHPAQTPAEVPEDGPLSEAATQRGRESPNVTAEELAMLLAPVGDEDETGRWEE